MKHKHSELIKAWADGALIEYKATRSAWQPCAKNEPAWDVFVEYRVAPTPKPDVVKDLVAWFTTSIVIHEGETSNLRLTFSGETGKLKAAEVIE